MRATRNSTCSSAVCSDGICERLERDLEAPPAIASVCIAAVTSAASFVAALRRAALELRALARDRPRAPRLRALQRFEVAARVQLREPCARTRSSKAADLVGLDAVLAARGVDRIEPRSRPRADAADRARASADSGAGCTPLPASGCAAGSSDIEHFLQRRVELDERVQRAITAFSCDERSTPRPPRSLRARTARLRSARRMREPAVLGAELCHHRASLPAPRAPSPATRAARARAPIAADSSRTLRAARERRCHAR